MERDQPRLMPLLRHVPRKSPLRIYVLFVSLFNVFNPAKLHLDARVSFSGEIGRAGPLWQAAEIDLSHERQRLKQTGAIGYHRPIELVGAQGDTAKKLMERWGWPV